MDESATLEAMVASFTELLNATGNVAESLTRLSERMADFTGHMCQTPRDGLLWRHWHSARDKASALQALLNHLENDLAPVRAGLTRVLDLPHWNTERN